MQLRHDETTVDETTEVEARSESMDMVCCVLTLDLLTPEVVKPTP